MVVLLTDLTHHDFCLMFVLETFLKPIYQYFFTLFLLTLRELSIFINLGHASFYFCPFVKVLMSLCFSFHVSCDVFNSCIMNGYVFYNFDNRFIFIVVVLTCLLELIPTIWCQDIYSIFISNTLGYFVQHYKDPWETKVIGFGAFMRKKADLVELQQCSKWLWLCYDIDQFFNMVSLIWSEMKPGNYW